MNQRQKLVQQQFLNNEEAVINQLKEVYNDSLTEINNKIKNLTFTIDKLQREYDWMDPKDPKRAKVKSMIQSKIYQKQYQEQLQTQVDGILKKMQTQSYLTVSDYLEGCYNDGFIGTIFDAHGQGVPFLTPINQEAMVRAVQLESKISKGLYTRLGEDVDVLKKKITAEVSRAVATGMTFAQTAKALENYTRIGYNNAIRIARTEGHRIQTTATMDAMIAAKEKGADVVKQWDAALDARTRDSHVKVDGEVRELKKKFSNGLMYPGDPSGRAAEVVNCRCALLQRARWALDGKFSKFNNFTKETETFDSQKGYDKFKKSFFSNENMTLMLYVGKMEEKYGTKNFETILGSMTNKEYDHYCALVDKSPVYEGIKNGGMRFGVVNDAITSNEVSATINESKQNKHIPGTKEFTEGRSYLSISSEEAQQVVDELKGTGTPIFDNNGDWTHKERVKCSDNIGVHVDPSTGEETPTKNLTIIYSNTGSHIVPRKGG